MTTYFLYVIAYLAVCVLVLALMSANGGSYE